MSQPDYEAAAQWIERGIPAMDGDRPITYDEGVLLQARRVVDTAIRKGRLVSPEALIIQRDEFYEAAVKAKWPYEVDAMLAANWTEDGVNLVKRDVARSILDALASSQRENEA